MLAYLARYTHRVAIANSRLIALDDNGVTFKWKDYRIDGPDRYKVMTLQAAEFIRRFLIHVLPDGFHRIRHYGLFANGTRAENIARVRELLTAPAPQNDADDAADANEPQTLSPPCPCCGGRMIIIETFARLLAAHAPHRRNQDRHLMTIAASVRKTAPLRADPLAATAALAHIATGSPQFDQSCSINKAASYRPYPPILRISIKQLASATGGQRDRPASRSKSP